MMRKILFIAGMLLCAYPVVCNFVTEKSNQNVICAYQDVVENLDEAEVEKLIQEAEEYNDLREQTYQKVLNITEDGMMAVIEIPKIKLKLPIYHGTEEDVLSKGVGHVYGSSLPVGGKNTHSILAGHRGLLDSELFTRLNEMEEGDMFTINVCGEKLIYEVCAIHIVKPEETSVLRIQEGRDLVSLVTCTPYGINTHRLIVTGERRDYE